MNSAKNYSNFVLYSYFRSSCSWRVRIVLNLKKIKYDIKPTHLLKNENKSEDFEKINPFKKIPVLQFTEIIDSTEIIHTLAESIAICEFLDETFTDNIKLLPENSIDRAIVRAICTEIACNIQPIQNLPVINKIQDLGADKLAWAKEWITKGLSDLEKQLSSTRGKYSFGDNLTLADCFLVPQLYNARRFNVDLSGMINILEIENNLSTIDGFISAKPENQIDFEK